MHLLTRGRQPFHLTLHFHQALLQNLDHLGRTLDILFDIAAAGVNGRQSKLSQGHVLVVLERLDQFGHRINGDIGSITQVAWLLTHGSLLQLKSKS